MTRITLKKFTSRIWGFYMKVLVKTLCYALKRRNRMSWSVFLWAVRSYFCGTTQSGTVYDFGIVPKKPDAEGFVKVGDFKFVYDSQCANDVRSESADILAEYILSLDLEEYYRLYDGEGPYEVGCVSLHAGDIVIDAGANMGVFALLSVAKGAAKVYAFEPMEDICGILAKNIDKNSCHDIISIIRKGLSDKTGLKEIFFTDGNVQGASLVFKNTNNQKKIQCITLDEWVRENNIPCVDFIKADIEGAERYLLKGAQETLRRFKPRLAICTYHLPDDPQILAELIRKANPAYKIIQGRKKLYAWV